MWIYAVGAVAGVTVATIGRVLWKSVQSEEEQRIQGINTKLSMDAEQRLIDEREHVDDEASDLCKARVRRRMKDGEKCKEAPLIGKKRIHLVKAKRAG